MGLIAHIPAILWQRRWFIIIPTVLATLVGIVLAFTLKPIYRSQAVVVVESQLLPEQLVNSSLTDMIDQRIAKVRQRVLSRPDLIALIQRNNLYAEERQAQPLSQIIEKMRDATTVDAISSDVQSGRPSTIAFNIGFDYQDPVKAQLIAQEFVSRFLEIDSAEKAENAANAAKFLSQEGQDLSSQVAAIEAQISRIREENAGVLMQSMYGSSAPSSFDTGRIDAEINAITRDNNRLLAQKRQGGSGDEVARLEAALREQSAVLSDNHPDVVLLRQRLAEARQAAKSTPGRMTLEDAEIASNRARIQSLLREKAQVQTMNASSRAAASRAPVVLGEIERLEKQAEALRQQYQNIGGKVFTAQVAARMETEQKGERLTVADPPVVPDTPLSPNRPMLVLSGLAVGLMIGLALALGLEFLRRPIRGTQPLRELVGAPPLVVIPTLSARPSRLETLIQQFRRRAEKRRSTVRFRPQGVK